MTAALDTMTMTLSPGLDALRSSPLSGSTESLHLGDYLDLSSSTSSPRPAASAPLPRMTRSSANVTAASRSPVFSPTTTSAAASTGKSCAPNTLATTPLPPSEGSTSPIPPPGSSPEAVFRYYLKIELRKMGSPADDSIIDKYVQQHYNTFIKAMETGKAPSGGPAIAVGTPIAASSAPSTATEPISSLAPSITKSKNILSSMAPLAVDTPPLSSAPSSSQPQPFKVPLASESDGANPFDLSIPQQPIYDSIDPHIVQFGGISSVPYAGTVKRESDAMSEDGCDLNEQEDSKDDLAPLISDMRFTSGRGGSDGSGRYGSDAGSSRGSEEPCGGIPASMRDSAAADLRPTAEEYRALSSKEKRQLRNKISARNFRERRKEYITHLESKISSRDNIIDSLRAQLSAASLQNKKLEDEVKNLQARSLSQTDVQKILEALQNVTAGSSATNPATYPASNANADSYLPLHQGALRSSAANDLTLSSAGTGGSGASRPSTPSSPRPSMARRASPASFNGGSTGTSSSGGQLPQHNPRKDLSVNSSAKGHNGTVPSAAGFWMGGSTVAASA